jgi:hypothetical protein
MARAGRLERRRQPNAGRSHNLSMAQPDPEPDRDEDRMSPVDPAERAPRQSRRVSVKGVAQGCGLLVLVLFALIGLLFLWAVIDLLTNGIDITFVIVD